MAITIQQKQTRKFFEKDALNWAKKAKSLSRYSVNVINQRNQYVEKICSQFVKKNSKILDVGCGTGDLVISLLQKKYDAYGVDFASSMIKKARLECKKRHIPSDKFFLSSFFEFKPHLRYELISANGFIEYISLKQFEVFLERCYQLLESGGLLVIGSRNRLFNVFSFNDYTKAEIKGKNIIPLLNECMLFNSIKNFKELLRKDSIPTISRNLRNHSYTGIEVKTRYQYTPLQIIQKLHKYGFETIDLAPINIHLLTTSARSITPEIHDFTSNELQQRNDLYMNVIPQSSSFMVAARKK